jgi:hypothetical protein
MGLPVGRKYLHPTDGFTRRKKIPASNRWVYPSEENTCIQPMGLPVGRKYLHPTDGFTRRLGLAFTRRRRRKIYFISSAKNP